ncbi:MAG: hypothetical protein IIV03_07355, partial [Clostridia bacterium]|nr:hypothetical protein [Clostridia bacterium]
MPSLKQRLCAAFMLCAVMLSLSSCLIVINKPDSVETTDAVQVDVTTAAQVTEAPPAEEAVSANDEAKHRLDSMLDYDMGGKTFILVTSDSNVPLPVGTARVLDKTRWEVLNEVSEKYGAELVITRTTRAKMLS